MYNDSNDMPDCIYTRNYHLPIATIKERERNLTYLENVLPYHERHRIHLYLDPGGNISRDSLGNLKPDINKILDGYSQRKF